MPTRTKTITSACCNKPLTDAGQNASGPLITLRARQTRVAPPVLWVLRRCSGCLSVSWLENRTGTSNLLLLQVPAMPTRPCKHPPSGGMSPRPSTSSCPHLVCHAILPMLCPFNASCWQGPGGRALWSNRPVHYGSALRARRNNTSVTIFRSRCNMRRLRMVISVLVLPVNQRMPVLRVPGQHSFVVRGLS